MKKFLIGLVLSGIVISSVHSEKGLWLPMRLSELNEVELQKRGLQMSTHEIYHPDQVSLSDAVVLFGTGCSGAFVSQEGLLLTNYHCTRGKLFRVHDSLNIETNGYWAYQRSEELITDDLEVKVLSDVEDVSQAMIQRLQLCSDPAARRDSIKKIQRLYENQDKRLVSYYNDQYWYLLHYTVYKDVRLVGMPDQSMGRFGGEADNFQWPRHSADFALFRVYTDSTGAPATYHPNNRPFTPKHSLPISLDGYKENDLCLSLGYPGRSDRYQSALAIQNQIIQDRNIRYINEIRIVTKNQTLKQGDSSASAAKIKASIQACQNEYKRAGGFVEMAKRYRIVEQRDSLEKVFQTYFASDPKYRKVITDLNEFYTTFGNDYILDNLEMRSFVYNDLCEISAKLFFGEALTADQLELLTYPATSAYYRNYISRMLVNYIELTQSLPAAISDLYTQSKKVDMPSFVEHLFAKSILFNPKKLSKLSKKMDQELLSSSELEKLRQDPLIAFHVSFLYRHASYLERTEALELQLARAKELFMEGCMKMNAPHALAPDADRTLRVSYGVVKGYEKSQGVHCLSQTDLSGMMEKSLYKTSEYAIASVVKDLYTRKDYGIYGDNGTLYTSFLATLDGTPGSSGSPVVNARGEMIGIQFDTNYEGLSGSMTYLPEIQRAICVDIRYVLFMIDKYAGAKNIIEEMTFHAR